METETYDPVKVFKIYAGRDCREGVKGRYTFQGDPQISEYFGDNSLGCPEEEFHQYISKDSKNAGWRLGNELERLGYDSFQIINGKLWLGELEKRSWVEDVNNGNREEYLEDCANKCNYHDNAPYALADVEPIRDYDAWRIVSGVITCNRTVIPIDRNKNNHTNLDGVYRIKPIG